jgi:hypothetical protein
VIIFAYGILKCLLGKTFRTILRIFYQYRPRFHTETRRAIYSQESIYKKPLKEGICHLSMSDLKMTTSRREIIEVRIVPKSSCYVIEIVYERRSETTDKQQIAGVD